MTAEEICNKYQISLIDLQNWSNILTESQDSTYRFYEYHRKRPRKLTRKQKYGLLQECYGGPAGIDGPKVVLRDKEEYKPSRVSALYAISLYSLQKWKLQINSMGTTKFIEKSFSKFSQKERISLLYEASVNGDSSTCVKYDVEPNTLAFWRRRFNLHGEEGLSFRTGEPSRFSPEEKVKIVEVNSVTNYMG